MAKRYSAAELTERAAEAKRREEIRKARRIASPKPYTPQLAVDYSTIYYRDPVENGRYLEITVKKKAIDKFGGLANAGLLDEIPITAVAVPIGKGSKIPIVKVKWYFGDANVTPVTTPWGTRWVKKYDASDGQSHWSLPFSTATGTLSLDALVDRFRNEFNETDGTRRPSMLGANGYAELVIGYGNQYTVLKRY